MSLRIIKTGILDTIQDNGRYGYQHYGINPGGAMDRFSSRLSNALLGKELDGAVIEMHWPPAQILFEKETIISITGADFSPAINNIQVPINHPLIVSENSLLKFERPVQGARVYVSVLGDLTIDKWMDSYSTNTKARSGGFMGRSLERYDRIGFNYIKGINKILGDKDLVILPWTSHEMVENRNELEFIIGSEWHWLEKEMQDEFQSHWFQVTNSADRMGYRLAGPGLQTKTREQLVSAAACFGTVQLLPDGQLIVLMADHQTTGGYPRIAHIISAHLPLVAQKKPNDVMRFIMTDLDTAEEKLEKQQKYLDEIQIACKFKMQNILNAGL